MVSRQAEEGDQYTQAAAVTAAHSNPLLVSAEEIVPTLPLETRCPPFHLRQYGGFWEPEATLLVGIPTLHTSFKPRPTDVFLASVPKSGTTWLKALAFATLNRATHSPFDDHHPLRHRNPHDCVPFFEPVARNRPNLLDELEALPSPRVLGTHFPYSLLPDSIKDDDDGSSSAGSRIVYVSRDPKDVFVSSWFFINKAVKAMTGGGDDGARPPSFDFHEAFELFCEGRFNCGPQWHHVLEYWDESVRRPGKVLFLRYEEMLLDPKSNLVKLAKFIGREFSQEEEEKGVVDAIVELCSLDTLKNMEVNKVGSTNRFSIKHESYFRKGVAGDWRNHLTPEMAQRLDDIVGDALQGSGFTFF